MTYLASAMKLVTKQARAEGDGDDNETTRLRRR